MDTVEQIIGEVQGLVGDGADPNLAEKWVRDGFRRTLEVRHWSFLHKRCNLLLGAPITAAGTGETMTAVKGYNVLTFSGNVATTDVVGMQIRSGITSPIYDITGYIDATSVTIYPDWGGADASGLDFTIAQHYVPMPADYLMMRAVIDPVNRWRLHTNVPRQVIDHYDPARSRSSGQPVVLTWMDYEQQGAGKVYSALQIVGSGAKPGTGGTYSSPTDAIYSVEITLTGVGGVAEFQWRRNEGAWLTGVVSDTNGNTLPGGVTLSWGTSSMYVAGDLFIIRASALGVPSVPRMEVYPYPNVASVLPMYYVSRYPDITDPGVRLPGLLSGRGDIVKEKALEFAAAYPGPRDSKNTYDQINRRDYHALNWKLMVEELARQDNEIYQTNVITDPFKSFPFAPLPWYGGDYLQTHDAPDLYSSFW